MNRLLQDSCPHACFAVLSVAAHAGCPDGVATTTTATTTASTGGSGGTGASTSSAAAGTTPVKVIDLTSDGEKDDDDSSLNIRGIHSDDESIVSAPSVVRCDQREHQNRIDRQQSVSCT